MKFLSKLPGKTYKIATMEINTIFETEIEEHRIRDRTVGKLL